MPHHITAMVDAHPEAAETAEKAELADCIAGCFQCAQTCTACADACLAEDMVADLAACIRTDLDCADICAATGTILICQTASNPGGRDLGLYLSAGAALRIGVLTVGSGRRRS